ncbi:Ger(x)C family spore germination protein [Lysinibacillus capsici]|uniref:Ger(x)C family spore germination protein n=1 Tax=Lysinibacillus capsici TaxID=2115968 RepID=UPI002E23EB6C|nr:Ger(x)C family spore germination protein [Lysinibacillus capsici]
MTMNKFLFLILSSTLLLAGCWDVTEPQRMYYINAVGVDFEDDKYKVYLQIINFADVARSVQSGGDVEPAEVGYAEGKTIEEAIYKLYRSSDQEIFWGHMRYLIFSERAMENERSIPVIDTFIRFRETRYQIWVYCTKDPIDELMLVTPILRNSMTASKLSNPMSTNKQLSFIQPLNLRKLVIGLNEPSHEINIPYVKMMKNWENDKEQMNETTFSGFGILSKDGVKGFIEDSRARGNQWMNEDTKRGEVTFKLEGGERDYLTVDLENLNLEVKPIVNKNNQVVFEIDIKIQGTLNGFKGKITTDEVRKNIAQQIEKEVKETYQEGLKLDADVYRLSEYLYRSNVKVWKKIEHNGKIPLTENSIGKINVHVNKINPGRKTFEETIEE